MRIDDETRLFNKNPNVLELQKQGRRPIGGSVDGLSHRDLERAAEKNLLAEADQTQLRQSIQATRRPYIEMLIRYRVPLMDIVRQARAFQSVPNDPHSIAVKAAGVNKVGEVAGRLKDPTQPRFKYRVK